MDQLFAKYPTLLQVQDADGRITLWFLTGGDPNDATTWLSETRSFENCDPQMQADIITALGDRSEPQVLHHPVAQPSEPA